MRINRCSITVLVNLPEKLTSSKCACPSNSINRLWDGTQKSYRNGSLVSGATKSSNCFSQVKLCTLRSISALYTARSPYDVVESEGGFALPWAPHVRVYPSMGGDSFSKNGFTKYALLHYDAKYTRLS